MGYCKVHGEYYGYVCDGCQNAEWSQSNPGDYQCPHCKYTSLKYTASRCPLCHGEIETDYWIPVIAVVQAAEEKSRQLAQKYERESQERTVRNRIGRQNVNTFSLVGTGVVIAIFIFLVPQMINPSGKVCVGILGIVVIVVFLVFMEFIKGSKY